MNDDLSDIGTALTGSLARDGQGGMTDVLPLDNSGFAYVNDSNTGMERTGSDAQAIVCGGVNIVDVDSSGIDVTGDINASGTIQQNGIILLPVGLGPLPWAGATAPSGWLFCFGQSLLRTDYAALFTAIGTSYGSVDSTHFSLPDGRGRIIAGKDDMGGSAAGRLTSTTMTPDGVTLGAVGGEQTHTLILTETPSHDHGGATGSTTPTAGVTGGTIGGTVNGVAGGTGIGVAQGPTPIAVSVSAHTHPITAAGSGGAHNNVQSTIITNYIIFAGV